MCGRCAQYVKYFSYHVFRINTFAQVLCQFLPQQSDLLVSLPELNS